MFVQTSLLLIFFVSFKFLSVVFGFRVGGKTLSVFSGGFAGAWDFLTICKTTLDDFDSCLMIGGFFGPPGSGVLLLIGRSGSTGLSSRLTFGFRSSTVRLTRDFGISCVVEGTKTEFVKKYEANWF